MTTKVLPIINETKPILPKDEWIVWEYAQWEADDNLWQPKGFSTEQAARHYIKHYWDGEARLKLTKKVEI